MDHRYNLRSSRTEELITRSAREKKRKDDLHFLQMRHDVLIVLSFKIGILGKTIYRCRKG